MVFVFNPMIVESVLLFLSLEHFFSKIEGVKVSRMQVIEPQQTPQRRDATSQNLLGR